MGIQINGSTDTISAIDGSLTLEGGELRTVSGLNVTGVVTATSYQGDGSALTGIAATDNVRTGILDVAGVGTFRSDVNVPDSIIHLGDTDTKIRFPAADTVAFETGGSERARIDSSGNFGLGTASPASDALLTLQGSNRNIFFLSDGAPTDCAIDCAGGRFVFRGGGSGTTVASIPEQMRLDENGRLMVGTTDSSGTQLLKVNGTTGGSTNGGSISLTQGRTAPPNGSAHGVINFGSETRPDGGAQIVSFADGAWTDGSDHNSGLYFATTADGETSPTERMRITNQGFVLIGRTTGIYTEQLLVESNTQTVNPMTVSNTDTDNSAEYSILFRRNTSLVGSIQTTLSATSYVTTSDHRLKENVVPLTGAVDRVNQLQVHRFNFIVDPDTTVDGFLAHEAQAVVPEAVTGTHNEVEVWKEGEELPDGVSVGDNKLDEDGNTIPVYQGIDQSKLVPLLTAALQEAVAKIETLETANASQAATIAALDARLTALEGGN